MSDQHIDDLFKEEFDNYAPTVPGGTFERIIDERNKRRVAVVWWQNWRNLSLVIIFIIAILVAGGSYLFLNNKTSRQVHSAEKGESSGSVKTKPAAIVEAQTNVLVAGEQDSPATITDSGTQSNVISFGAATRPQVSDADVNSADDNDLAHQESLLKTQSAFNRADKNFGQKQRKSTGKTSVKSSEFNIDTADADDGSKPSEAFSNTTGSRLNRLSFDVAMITAASLASSNTANVSDGIKGGPDCPEAEKNAAGNKTYWEAYTSADYSSKKYSDTANSVFAAKRKATTSFHSAFSIGVRVTKVFNNGVSVRAGLNFSQINEKFSFVQSNTVQTTYIIDAATGDTTGSYIVKGTKYKTSFNRYRTLDIPLVIGYEVGNGRLHANFNAGAMINLYSWQKGELLDTAFQPVSITTGKGLPAFQYKTNIGVGFTAATSVYYKLNDKLHLLAEPYFRYNFSPMNREALSLQERFTTIGLRLGIRVDF